MKNRFPKRILAMILTLLMVLSILPTVFAENTTPFTDVEPDRWYTDAVNYVYEKGLMNGTSPTTFSPNLTANRAMVVTILYRNDGSPHVEFVPKFNDVEENRWYTDGVMWAVENEITKGTGAATFSPDRDITREELAVFLYRYAVYKGFDVSASADLSVYPDADQVHSWAKKEMQWAVGSEIIHGAGKPAQLLPRKTATRAELATMIQRFLLAQSLEGKTIILHTNDTHGALMGFAQVAKVRKDFESRGAKVILADAGDFSQGTTYVSANKGEAAITMLKAAGYDFITLGNHEFDFGYAQLMANLEKGEGQFVALCADVFDKATSESILPTYAIKEIDGMKIGFFGMETPETQTKVNPGLITEIEFGTNENGRFLSSAQSAVAELKEEGADLIVGLVHLGVDNESEPYRSIDLYEQLKDDVDFMIDGHSHTVMTAGPNGEPIQSTGTKASKTALMNVGCIVIDNETRTIEDNYLIPLGEDAPVDEGVAAVAQEIMDAVDDAYGAVFAKSLVDLNGDKVPGNRNMETNLGDLITDSMRWGVLKDMDAETLGVPAENVVAITNGGGIRAWIHKGDVTKNDVNTVLPFGNTVAVVYVTGAELLEALEASTYSTPGAVGGFPQVSGMKYNIDTEREFAEGDLYPGSTYHRPEAIVRVTIDEINGQAFDPEATYAVVTNNFCAAGGDTYYVFQNASAQFDTGLPMDEVLMDYITTELEGVIGEDYAEPQGRITQEHREKELDGKTVILHTNDTHGALLGFAQVAAVKAEYLAKGAKVLLADAGDYSQGTIYVSTNKGEAAVTMLNAAGYDLATLGNHEFDFGYAQLMANMEKAEFQPIVADVLLKQTGKSIFDGHVVKEVGGVKIGFFGMETPETFTKVNPGLIQEITFPQGEAMYACAQAEVDALKEEGADLIIGLVHLGVDAESEPNRSIDLYENVTGIDFLIDGHSHTVMTAGPNGEPIQSTGTKASDTALMNVGFIQIDNETKTIEENKLIPLGEDAPVNEAVAAVAKEITEAIDAEYNAKFAESLVDLNGDKAPGNRNMETNLGDLITDAMLWGVGEVKDQDGNTVPAENVVAITNGGGIRAWIHVGDVTKKDVNTVLPFGNTVAVVCVTGAELLEALEASTYATPGPIGGFPQIAGMKISIDTTKDYDQGEQYPDSTYYAPASIQRVTINEINGKDFDPEATYAVVTNNFCAAGGDTYHAFKAASYQFDTSLPLDEILMDYITEELGGVIDETYADPQGRITVLESTEPEDIIIGGLDANLWTTKYGNIYTSCTAARLQEMGFAYGDIVTVKFLDKVLDLPLVPTFSYVDQGTPGLFINKSETGGFDGYLFMAINMGNFTTTYGIATKTTNEDGTWYWTACEGVEFPIVVTLEMKEQGGYLDEMLLRDINRTNNREDYPDLTDEEFANFRQITTTGMGDHLYRGSSPINPEIGRNTYADAAIENAGVTVIMNLANNQADAEAYAGYTETYYSKQNVIFLNLGVDFQAEDFQAGLANGLRHFAENKGVYYVHCTEGKDRAGFVSALLECLMGATYDEVVADYLKTYTNYYTVVDGVHQALSQETLDAIADSNIIKTLKTAFDVEDLTTANLADEAAAYIREIGLTDEQIAALKENLAGTGEEPTVSYEVADTVAAGDQIIMVYTVNDKYYAMSSDVSDYGIMTPVEVTFTDGALTAPDSSTVFTLAAGSEEGSYQLQTADGKALNYSSSGTGISLQDAGSDWTLTLGAGTSKVKAANATNRYLFVQNFQDALRIKCYTESNMTASNYYATATLYKVVTAG